MNLQQCYQAIPSVDACKKYLFSVDPTLCTQKWAQVHASITKYWAAWRDKIRTGSVANPEELALDNHKERLLAYVSADLAPRLRRVINATGVVVHTNLGRSVLSSAAQEAVHLACSGYTNLELNLETGERGSRYALIEELLCSITGAEAAMVVNNNAAAVLLMLDTFCQNKEVIVSRGELVEIGGNFRIPEVMAKGGALLREVGTTNRTHLRDYAAALNEHTAALMRVHTSNYRIIGFHKQVALTELAHLAHAHNLLLFEDLGSGSLVHFAETGLPEEPTVQDAIAAGVDVVSFSGDKVLGGPQAGILVGKSACISAMKANQLTRALRCDKLCFAALEATLREYVDPSEAKAQIPTLACILKTEESLRTAAEKLAQDVQQTLGDRCNVRVLKGVSRVGGGAFAQCDLPTYLVALSPCTCSLAQWKQALLQTSPPLLGRIEQSAFCLDPRTLEEHEYPVVVSVLKEAMDFLRAEKLTNTHGQARGVAEKSVALSE